ncbi:hypothetical protein GGX14DRAFT_401821 [Mycena pura]|uniref:Carbohydrate esterase family 16 protein n=1 Tax=Mycena pura TaxID=153505 RepID=A0AAD6V3P1_9AGAR|nr:hypothetical protein GGX14DRAFT_401821 [Mycena pura]
MVFAPLVFVVAAAVGATAVGVSPGQITDLVTFGDSYTDVVAIGDLGTAAWPNYTATYAGIRLHPFAKSGAVCSNNLTRRPFPSFLEDEIPTYLAEIANRSLVLRPENTLYTIWFGTNDIGRAALLTGDDPGVSLVEVTACIIQGVKTLYKSGARNFIFQNMIPLELTVLYAANSYPNSYWVFERNTTEWSIFMREMTHSVNKLAELMLQALIPTLPGAHIALFDSHSLFQDMYDHPALYLNGTAPLNVTSGVPRIQTPSD